MSYQIKKHKKVILDPLSTFNDLFKKAETLYNIEQNYSKTSRNSNSIKSELSRTIIIHLLLVTAAPVLHKALTTSKIRNQGCRKSSSPD